MKSFINELDRRTASFTDVEFVMLKQIVERRGRDAHATVAPVDTAQTWSPRSRSSGISFDVRVCMEKNDEGRMDPEPGKLEQSSAGADQLKSPSTGTGFETPGQQCLPNWKTGRTTAAGCLPAGVRSKFGRNTFSLAEIATPSTASTTVFLQAGRKPKDKKIASEENKQLDPGGKGGEPPP